MPTNIRSTDPTNSEEFKKRALQMPVVLPRETPLINGQVGKLLGLVKIVKEIGLETLIFTLITGWLFGFWQIPLVDRYLSSLVSNTTVVIQKLDSIQRQLDYHMQTATPPH